MWESLNREPGMLPMILFWAMIFLVILATYGLKTWRKHEAAKMEYELKLEMINRGMTADEIERILAAKSTTSAELAETRSYAKN
jgi:hypothetical protein